MPGLPQTNPSLSPFSPTSLLNSTTRNSRNLPKGPTNKMAKFTVSVTVLLFLFTFSDAHLQVYPNNDVTKPETDADPILLLPSEKSESAADVEIEAVDVSDLVNLPLPEEPTATFVKFRPINRHFGVRRQFPLRYMRRRPCRHHHKSPVSAARSHEISYGDDMILDPRSLKISYGDDVSFDRDQEVLFRDHVMPSMSHRFQEESGVHHHHHRHHHRSKDKFMPKYVFAKEKLKRPFRREKEEEEILKEKKHDERVNGGFVTEIRKFLNHF